MGSKKRKRKAKKFNLQHWLIQKIRRISYQYPPRKDAIKKARVSRGKYKCALCLGEEFGPKDIQLDHIEPVINPHEGFQDWNTYIDRLFVDIDGWQVCCKECHKIKTFQENAVRTIVRHEKDIGNGDDI